MGGTEPPARRHLSLPVLALGLSLSGLILLNLHAARRIMEVDMDSVSLLAQPWVSSALYRETTPTLGSPDAGASQRLMVPPRPSKTVLRGSGEGLDGVQQGKGLPPPPAVPAAPPPGQPGQMSNTARAMAFGDPPVPAMYGGAATGPRIIGLERCAAFRERVALAGAEPVVAPAGLFNTGTNLLNSLLGLNCRRPSNGRWRSSPGPFLWQVPWGKHNPLSWRGSHFAPSSRGQNVSTVIPVMLIKDPLTWMKSMCRHAYAARFKTHRANLCPSPVEASETTVAFQKDRQIHYDSLLHLWNQWNRAYLDSTLPRLIVRYEDLLFTPDLVLQKVCSCVGGVMASESFKNLSESSKKGLGHGDGGSDRAKALARYGSQEARLSGYTQGDIRFIQRTWEANLVDTFLYGDLGNWSAVGQGGVASAIGAW